MMRKFEIYKLLDTVDDLKKIESLIDLHTKMDESKFMVSQYEAKKIKLIGDIIDSLTSPDIQSAQSYSIIEMLLQKYYPMKENSSMEYDKEMARLAAAI